MSERESEALILATLKEIEKLRAENEKLRAVVDAAMEYMHQPGMSCYLKKSDWEADSDIRGQALLDALDALDEAKELKDE